MPQIIQNRDLIAGNESTDGCQGLTKGAHKEIHLLGQAKVIRSSGPLIPHDSQSVGVVQINQQVRMPFLQTDEFRQGHQVPRNAKDSLSDQNLNGIGATRDLGHFAGRRLGVIVPERYQAGPGCLPTLENAGMVFPVAKKNILRV